MACRGWGAISYAANNTIVGNSCHDYKTLLNDGGCIYSTCLQLPVDSVRTYVYGLSEIVCHIYYILYACVCRQRSPHSQAI